MKRLKALKDVYHNGQMIHRGQTFNVQDDEARLYVRERKAEIVPGRSPLVAALRRTKIVQGKEEK
jgi:hypothetical protein